MYIKSIWPFVVYHFDKGEEPDIAKCLEALKELREYYEKTGGVLSKERLEEARIYYKKLREELREDLLK